VTGGLVGGWLFSLIGIATDGWIGEIITAIVGAVVVLLLFRQIKIRYKITMFLYRLY